MAYFSNGSEGMDYEQKYCRRCVHDTEGQGCAVLLLHLLWNYDASSDAAKKTALDTLIPRTKDGLWNEQCRMFHAEESAK